MRFSLESCWQVKRISWPHVLNLLVLHALHMVCLLFLLGLCSFCKRLLGRSELILIRNVTARFLTRLHMLIICSTHSRVTLVFPRALPHVRHFGHPSRLTALIKAASSSLARYEAKLSLAVTFELSTLSLVGKWFVTRFPFHNNLLFISIAALNGVLIVRMIISSSLLIGNLAEWRLRAV